MSDYQSTGGATPGKERRKEIRKKLTEGAAKNERVVVLKEHKQQWKPNKLQLVFIALIICTLALFLVSFVYQHTGDRVVIDNGHEKVIALLETYEGPEKVEFFMFVDIMLADGITKSELEDIEYYHKNYEAP